MVRERELARELQQRVVVLADDVGTELRVALHLLPVRRREPLALAQDLGGHAELADVVQRRGLHHHVADRLLGARRLRDQLGVLRKAHDPIAHRRALVQLHHARQAPDQLGAGLVELLGALRHRALQHLLPVGEAEVQADAQFQHPGIGGLDHVIHRADLQALQLGIALGLAGEEDHRDVVGVALRLQYPADVEPGGAGHLDVEQDQVGPRRAGRQLERGPGVLGGQHLVVVCQHFRGQRKEIARVVDHEDDRAFRAHSGGV